MESQWHYSRWKMFAMHMRFAARIIIMASALLFIGHLGGYNPTRYIIKYKFVNFVVILAVVASVLYYMFNRNFYLPFLGWSVYPCGSLAEKVPLKADTSISVKVPPNVNVIYWASEPTELQKMEEPIDNPWDAYANYENSGVVKADASGNAILRFRTPSSYNVGLMNKTLKRHVHYRVCKHPGMLSDIKTVFV